LKNEPEGGSEAIRRQAPFLFGFWGSEQELVEASDWRAKPSMRLN
jgi:hypothetical protein